MAQRMGGIPTLLGLANQIQQYQHQVRVLQNLASARSVVFDERDNWTVSNGASTSVTQRIMMDFNRKIAELDSDFAKVVNELVNGVNTITTALVQAVKDVLNGPFTTWRMDQKMGQIGFPEQADLRQNAELCLREVTAYLYRMRDILTEMQAACVSSNDISNWILGKLTEYRHYLFYLIQRSFVVYKQPPMLVKDWTLRMDISVKIMADIPTFGTNGNLRRGPVHCCMITEKQAEWLCIQKDEIDFSQVPIDAWSFGHLSSGVRHREMARENCIKAEWNDVSGEAEFTAVRTKIENRKTNESKDKAARVEVDQKPVDKKTDKMTEKKLYFLFFCQINMGEENHWLWTLSLPFLVAVQTMQEWHLLGVIFWDTAFSSLDSIPCDGRQEVTWGELKMALKWLFGREVQTETRGDSMSARELTQEELNHLGTRIIGGRQALTDDCIVRRSDVFMKLTNDSAGRRCQTEQRGFTFWQWFYGCMDLLQDRSGKILRYHNGKTRKRSNDEKKTMATLFNDGIIRGFVSRDSTERLLKTCPQTNIMLIRFSDNHCRHDDPNSVPAGYLSITCKVVKEGRDTIINIKPLNRELLSRLTLPFVVAHCEYLNNVNHVYVGEDRWVDKKRLIVNYIPLLTQYSQYEGYEKLLLNFNTEENLDEKHGPNSVSNFTWPSSNASPQLLSSYRRTESSFSEASPVTGGFSEAVSPILTMATATESPSSQSSCSIGSQPPPRLMELLSEPPNRQAAFPSKYDEVLSYLISGTESTTSTDGWVDFQPEDDATLCRSFTYQ